MVQPLPVRANGEWVHLGLDLLRLSFFVIRGQRPRSSVPAFLTGAWGGGPLTLHWHCGVLCGGTSPHIHNKLEIFCPKNRLILQTTPKLWTYDCWLNRTGKRNLLPDASKPFILRDSRRSLLADSQISHRIVHWVARVGHICFSTWGIPTGPFATC